MNYTNVTNTTSNVYLIENLQQYAACNTVEPTHSLANIYTIRLSLVKQLCSSNILIKTTINSSRHYTVQSKFNIIKQRIITYYSFLVKYLKLMPNLFAHFNQDWN